MVIKQKVLDHKGGFYFYRVHTLKLNNLCQKELYPLREYLENIFHYCPNEYFFAGPRSSSLKFNLSNLNLKSIPNHELCLLTDYGLKNYKKRYKTPHSQVQVFMLENDNASVASEIPLWIKPEELNYYKDIFYSNEVLTGHIDILRVENNKIWVLDYKPNAADEKYASTQVYFYALMLSKRINLPLDYFMCGYFDNLNCYLFNPQDCKLPMTKQLQQF